MRNEMKIDYVTILGYPQPKERSGVGAYGNLYKKKKTRDYETRVMEEFGKLMGANVYRGLIYVDIICIFKRTKELCKQYKNGTYKYGTKRIAHLIKPDHDNIRKSVLDGFQCFMDGGDCRVIGGLTMKYYANIRDGVEESERVIVRVVHDCTLEELHGFMLESQNLIDLLNK